MIEDALLEPKTAEELLELLKRFRNLEIEDAVVTLTDSSGLMITIDYKTEFDENADWRED